MGLRFLRDVLTRLGLEALRVAGWQEWQGFQQVKRQVGPLKNCQKMRDIYPVNQDGCQKITGFAIQNHPGRNTHIYIFFYLDLSTYIHLWKQTWQWKITGANKNHESCERIHHNNRPHLANLRDIIAKAEGTTCATWKNKLQVELVFVFLLIFWIHHHEKSAIW